MEWKKTQLFIIGYRNNIIVIIHYYPLLLEKVNNSKDL